MEVLETQVVASYTEAKLSEKQVANLFSISPNRVRRILDSHEVVRRSHGEASRQYHITNFDQPEFVLRSNLTHEEELLKVAGVMLYWGEGTKEWGTVALSNSDPKMIALFLKFLRVICGISEKRIHATLHYYSDQDPEKLTEFWADVTQIPLSQFYKPFLHPQTTRGTYRELSKYGTLSLQYSDTKLRELICSWIAEYSKAI